MSVVDYKMAERTSELALEYLQKNESIPNYIFQNLLISTSYLTLNHEKLGPNVEMLYQTLEASYTYDEVNKLPGFDMGAIYGATQFYKMWQELTNINILNRK